MDKQTLTLVVVCILLLFLWGPIMDKIWPPPPKKTQTASSTNQLHATEAIHLEKPVSSESILPESPQGSILNHLKKSNVQSAKTLSLENEFVNVTFTSRGGGIEQIVLKKFFDHEKTPIILNDKSPVPVLSVISGDIELDAEYVLVQKDNQITATYQSPKGLVITKEYTLKEDYQIGTSITLKNGSQAALEDQSLRMALGLALPMVDRPSKKEVDPAQTALIGLSFLSHEKPFHENLPSIQKFIEKQQKPYEKNGPLFWAAIKNQYLTILATPTTPFSSIEAEPYVIASVQTAKGIKEEYGLLATVSSSSFDLQHGDSFNVTLNLYSGPKEYKRLSALGQKQEDILEFGMFKFFATLLLQLLSKFHSVFGNWGVAIITLTVLVKVVFWPLTAMSTKSMKKMQALAPKMNALKEKYKDDTKKLNEEMMKMYREYRINPAAGCLPMLVQMPIFFAFYTMIQTAIELRGASFLWIHDLSRPDTIAQFIGFNLNLMPLLMAATMIWQTKITPQAPNTDPTMKMMMWFMPATFLFVCYNFSSGLSLYWTAQNLLTILQTFLTRDKPVEPPKKVKPRGSFTFGRSLEK